MNFVPKKKPIKKYSQAQKQNTFLYVQVFQMGILQIEKSFSLNSFFLKKVRLGCNRFCDLYIPFESHALDLDIFKVGNGKAEIFLDPRLDGYINTSHKFGDVREFTSPREALGVLTSIDDPLGINLNKGARGRVRFLGFEIVFKIDGPIKEKIFHNLPVAQRNFFQLPSMDSPIEKNAIFLAMIAMTCLFVPVLLWLLKYPSQSKTGLMEIPTEVTAEFIAPENMRLLPYIFENDFVPENTPILSMLWIYELQKRWESSEQGIEYHSNIPILAKPKAIALKNTDVEEFQKKVLSFYDIKERERLAKGENDPYYLKLKKSPRLATVMTGREGRSNYATIQTRLDQLIKTDNALVEYLKLEHAEIKKFYRNNYNAKKAGIVVPPLTGQLLGAQPDPKFTKEYEDYKDAEYFASLSENSLFRMNLKETSRLNAEKEKNRLSQYTKSVFISSNSLLYPYEFMEPKENLNREEDVEAFLYNSIFSQDYIDPPKPKPKPSIDTKMVEFVVYNKKGELRSCYNSALRKDIHLKGDIKLSWDIDGFGKAHNIKIINSNINNKYLFQCVETRIKSWKFPGSKNGLFHVDFPFKFVTVENE